jgi:hypothetical protein
VLLMLLKRKLLLLLLLITCTSCALLQAPAFHRPCSSILWAAELQVKLTRL